MTEVTYRRVRNAHWLISRDGWHLDGGAPPGSTPAERNPTVCLGRAPDVPIGRAWQFSSAEVLCARSQRQRQAQIGRYGRCPTGRTAGLGVMPIPAAPDDEPHDVGSRHRAIPPVAQRTANSIATIITHLLGSEGETLRCVAGVENVRDRDAEFRMGDQTADALLAQVEGADELLNRLEPALTPERLQIVGPLPTLSGSKTRPGMTWLIGNLGHAREHIGHAYLTKQIWESNPH